jgi:hypothetical protein
MRRFPGALALGLIAAFLAHTVAYGNDHVMGGSYGTLLRGLAWAAALGLGAFWFAICLASRGRLCNGSVLSASIRHFFPSWAGVLAASFGWFWLAESVEDGHVWAPTVCIVLALLLAVVAIRLVALAALRALAKIAFLSFSGAFENRAPSWIRFVDRPIVSIPIVRALRLFSRPPPIRFSY